MEIKEEICNECLRENDWKEIIFVELEKKYPEEFKKYRYRIGINSDHPFLILHSELWKQYYQKCLVFEYDDCKEAICEKHLQELIRKMYYE